MTCTYCYAPTATGIHLCDTCSDKLHAVISSIPELLDDMTDTIAKLDNTAGNTANGAAPGFDSTAPARLTPLIVSRELRELGVLWSRMVHDYDKRKTPPRKPALEFLRGSVNEIRKHDFAGDMLDELDRKTREATRLIDLPVDVKILGHCGETLEDETRCGYPLKTDGERARIACQNCGAFYYVTDLEAYNKRRARGELMTAAQVRKYLKEKADITVKTKDLQNWVYHGLLGYVLDRVRNNGGRDKRMYYPGDILEVQHEMDSRRRYAYLDM